MMERHTDAAMSSKDHGRLFGSRDILEWCPKGLCFPSFRDWVWYGSVSERSRYSQAIQALKMPLAGNVSSTREHGVFSRYYSIMKLKLKVRGNASLKVGGMVPGALTDSRYEDTDLCIYRTLPR